MLVVVAMMTMMTVNAQSLTGRYLYGKFEKDVNFKLTRTR